MRYGNQVGIGCLAAAMLLPAMAAASGARQGVKPVHGEMVLLRDVPARPAYRMAPPGMALIVDPSPKNELSRILGTPSSAASGELSDDEYAALDSGMSGQPHPGAAQTTVERVTGTAVNGSLRYLSSDDGTLGASALTQTIGGTMGVVGNATRGIGDQVRGALAQFPLSGAAVAAPGAGAPPGN